MSDKARQNLRKRDRLKKQRKRAKLKAARLMAVSVRHGTSKTSKVYRDMLGPAAEMSKTQMCGVIAEAVRNTNMLTAPRQRTDDRLPIQN
jgi:hypothetical protein